MKKNSLLSLIKKRYSVRKYLNKPIRRTLIKKCLEAARLAPSAENMQPWRYLVVDNPELLNKLKQNAFSGIYKFTQWATSAPVIIVVLAKTSFITHKIGAQIQNIKYHLLDIGIATEHLILQATELGLGTCWIGWFNVKKVRKILQIPKKYEIVSLITLGYFKKEKTKKRKKRKKLEEIAFFNEIK